MIGNFAVERVNNKNFKIVEETFSNKKSDDLGSQGYPFYAGKIILSQKFEINREKN